MYLSLTDYEGLIKSELLAQLCISPDLTADQLRQSVETSIQEVLMGRLSYIYDVDLIFLNYSPYVTTQPYNIGDRILIGNAVYACNANGVTGTFDSTKFNLLFTRNPAVTMYYMDMVIYTLYARVSTKDIPIDRVERNKKAEQTFDRVAKQEETLRLPLLLDAQTGKPPREESALTWKSNQRFSVRGSRYF